MGVFISMTYNRAYGEYRMRGQMAHSIETIRQVVTTAASGVDIVRAYLFGSYARGEAENDSDVDLCLETGPSFSLFSAGSFAYEVERSLGVSVDVTSEGSLFPATHANMLKDRVLLYERT